MVLFRFRRERPPEERLERQPITKRCAQIGFFFAEQAGAEAPICREPHPVAAAAVGMGERRDDADGSLRAFKTKIPRRSIPPRRPGGRLDLTNSLEPTQNL